LQNLLKQTAFLGIVWHYIRTTIRTKAFSLTNRLFILN
jgi:hypothetical protein